MKDELVAPGSLSSPSTAMQNISQRTISNCGFLLFLSFLRTSNSSTRLRNFVHVKSNTISHVCLLEFLWIYSRSRTHWESRVKTAALTVHEKEWTKNMNLTEKMKIVQIRPPPSRGSSSQNKFLPLPRQGCWINGASGAGADCSRSSAEHLTVFRLE